jgi:DNA modification methylase
MTVELLNIDCMEYMATLPDNAFDLAIVDPPYGGFDFVGCELDADYYNAALKRFDMETSQASIFN